MFTSLHNCGLCTYQLLDCRINGYNGKRPTFPSKEPPSRIFWLWACTNYRVTCVDPTSMCQQFY